MADPDYFTLAEFRKLPGMTDANTYTDEDVLAAAAFITAIIEREVGTSFIARTVTEEIHNGGGCDVVLHNPYILSITSASVGGVAVTDELRAPLGGVLQRFTTGSYDAGSWVSGTGNISVTYEAGYSTEPPADIKQAAMQATRARLLETASNSGIDDRRTSLSTDMGTIDFVIAGEGRPTGYPVVDEVIMGWKRKLDHFGFA